ncbi:MAG: hypothetical protein EP334_00240, partial [Gammaproteobacteria bacterium]
MSWRCWLQLLMLALLIPGLPAVAIAADEAKEQDQRQYANVKTRQRQAVGQACATRLEKIQQVFQGETAPPSAQLKQLLVELKGLTEKVCASSYEKSQVYNLLGYSYYSLEQYSRAVDSYLAMIAEPDVDERQKASTRYTIAQLYFLLEKYAEAAKQLEQWQLEATVVSGDGRVLLAQA